MRGYCYCYMLPGFPQGWPHRMSWRCSGNQAMPDSLFASLMSVNLCRSHEDGKHLEDRRISRSLGKASSHDLTRNNHNMNGFLLSPYHWSGDWALEKNERSVRGGVQTWTALCLSHAWYMTSRPTTWPEGTMDWHRHVEDCHVSSNGTRIISLGRLCEFLLSRAPKKLRSRRTGGEGSSERMGERCSLI